VKDAACAVAFMSTPVVPVAFGTLGVR
jgi:hypothetical protein